MANLIRKIYAKRYQNRSRFVKDMTKRYGCVVRFAIPTAVHLQNANAKFHKVEYRHYSGEVENDYIFLCDNFTQDNMYHILSESVAF